MFPGNECAGIGPAGWLLMIGFWATVIAVIVWAVTRLFPAAQQRQAPGSVSTIGWPAVRSTPPRISPLGGTSPVGGDGRDHP